MILFKSPTVEKSTDGHVERKKADDFIRMCHFIRLYPHNLYLYRLFQTLYAYDALFVYKFTIIIVCAGLMLADDGVDNNNNDRGHV